MNKRVAIYCGANPGYDPAIVDEVKTMADRLSRKGWGLVFGGGKVGLMGIVADVFLANRAEVVGVIPEFMVPRELAHPGATQMLVVESMHDRKREMTEMSDAVIILPGGFGTMDELFETLTWAQLRLISKPIVIYNINGFYNPLRDMLDKMVANGFLKPANRDMLKLVSDIPNLLTEIEKSPPEAVDKWYDKI